MLSHLLKLIGIALLGIAPAVASVSIYMPPEQLARRADLVVEATVVRTASGFDPAAETLQTYVTLDIERVHRGPQELERVVVREPGGRHGDLMHVVDAVPVYEVGERVLAFLEADADGALRTSGMFYGKFGLEDAAAGPVEAVRDLEGQGTILRGPEKRLERMRLSDLQSITTTVQRDARLHPSGARQSSRFKSNGRGRSRALAARTVGEAVAVRPAWVAEPPEYAGLLWDDVDETPGQRRVTPASAGPDSQGVAADADGSMRRTFTAATPTESFRAAFVPADVAAPARWVEADFGAPVGVQIQRAGDPLGNGAAAVTQMQRAMAAWTDVPSSRLVLQAGNTNYNYTGSFAVSPAVSYSGVSIILFGDPYGDISDPSNCSGVLAIGGYWRSGTLSPGSVNGVSFYPALQAYVIFNNGFECFLGDPDNLAEVATHELGHAVGFGHSTEPDAIMRSFAYGFRGPRLGDDDQDAAHCHYPHTLEATRPDGGEVWAAGSLQTIQWTATAEQGPDPGTVDIEYSTDGGGNWNSVVSDTPNDGSHTWLVPSTPGGNTRVRIVRYRLGPRVLPGYPASCSGDASDLSFSIVETPPVAGAVPDGSSGSPLRVEPAGAGQLRLSWDASCSPAAENYAVYEGSLASLRAGVWEHQPVTCAGTDVVEYVNPQAGNRYFLVAPLAGSIEGDLGASASGSLRPESVSACGVRQAGVACDP